jgi:hypothetical protein
LESKGIIKIFLHSLQTQNHVIDQSSFIFLLSFDFKDSLKNTQHLSSLIILESLPFKDLIDPIFIQLVNSICHPIYLEFLKSFIIQF